MKTVIMAGGRGTRIASINAEVPKPMIPIMGKSILEYQIECLSSQGYTDIIIVVGYLGAVIKDYFKDGTEFGVKITYITEEQPLGTAGALFLLKDLLQEDFLLINGDVIFNVDLQAFYRFHKARGGEATIITHPNSHPYDSGIIEANESGRITRWLCKEDARTWYKNRVNAGLHFLSPKVLDQLKKLEKVDLDRQVLKGLVQRGVLYAYDTPEYIKDMGTPDRFQSVQADIESGKVRNRNLKNKQKAVFLDRDGTINRYVGFLTSIDEFELLPDAADAIKQINNSEYLAIVVTNQPVIARGEVTKQELQEIHNKMETLLGEKGAFLDAIYYCPHHPDKGFMGEVPEYKIECECRKPKPGMLLEAAKTFNIDLKNSWMIGDSQSDIEAGRRAGCQTKLIDGTKTLKDCIEEILQ